MTTHTQIPTDSRTLHCHVPLQRQQVQTTQSQKTAMAKTGLGVEAEAEVQLEMVLHGTAVAGVVEIVQETVAEDVVVVGEVAAAVANETAGMGLRRTMVRVRQRATTNRLRGRSRQRLLRLPVLPDSTLTTAHTRQLSSRAHTALRRLMRRTNGVTSSIRVRRTTTTGTSSHSSSRTSTHGSRHSLA